MAVPTLYCTVFRTNVIIFQYNMFVREYLGMTYASLCANACQHAYPEMQIFKIK